MANILTIAEQRDGALKKSSFEVLAIARRLADASGGTVTTVVAGSGIDGLAATLGQHGADKVLVADDAALALPSVDGYVAAFAKAAEIAAPELILAGHTAQGRDLVPRLAARLDAGLATDCTAIDAGDGDRFLFTRPVYSGKAYEQVEIPAGVQIATVRPNSYKGLEADAGRSAESGSLELGLDAATFRAKATDVRKAEGAKVDLSEATTIVSGGRAMKDADNFKLLWELQAAIGEGSTVGASRAAVDSGYAPHTMQVGQTGKVVNPNLYMAFGISGAIQHLAGMRTSKIIVAVNKDADAPIFQKADYGIVGDLFELVPLITEEVRKIKSEG